MEYKIFSSYLDIFRYSGIIIPKRGEAMNGVIQISDALSLALHGMGLLASSGKRMNVREMAERINVSEAHLAKVFQRIVKSGLVYSTRGPSGGFELTRPPSEISLYEIYEIIEGVPDSGYCLLKVTECPFNSCVFGGMIESMTREFTDYLKNRNLEELIRSEAV